jgi:hypothetical protein
LNEKANTNGNLTITNSNLQKHPFKKSFPQITFLATQNWGTIDVCKVMLLKNI